MSEEKAISLDNLQRFKDNCDKTYEKILTGADGIDIKSTFRNFKRLLTWTDISNISKSGRAQELFSIGDEWEFKSTIRNGTVQIIGFNHDDLSDGSGKAGISFLLKFFYSTLQSNMISRGSINNWKTCNMRNYLENSFYTSLEDELKNVIRTVKKKTVTSGGVSELEESDDNLFLLSYTEITGNPNPSVESAMLYEGEAYQYFKDAKVPRQIGGQGTISTEQGSTSNYYNPDYDSAGSAEVVLKDGSSVKVATGKRNDGAVRLSQRARGTGEPYWLRSPDYNSEENFYYIDYSGRYNNLPQRGFSGKLIVFGFCI